MYMTCSTYNVTCKTDVHKQTFEAIMSTTSIKNTAVNEKDTLKPEDTFVQILDRYTTRTITLRPMRMNGTLKQKRVIL